MAARGLLYLTNMQASVWRWQGAQLSPQMESFEHNENGWQAFGAWLKRHPGLPLLVLSDFIEENFKRDHVPHVRGQAHRNLIARRAAQLYRETPYTHASAQEREEEGRRDDMVLFSALTNVSLVQGWLRQIHLARAPFLGMYSVALLGPLLFRKLRLDIEHLLLVTRQSNGLRQSYFLHGRLRFSRLVPLLEDSALHMAEKMVVEINKTREFLASTRLLARSEEINVGILAGADVLDFIENSGDELALQQHQFFDLDQAAKLLSLRLPPGQRYADALFLSVLAKHPPPNQYAPAGASRHYQLLRLQTACRAAGVACAGVALLYCANAWWQTWRDWQETRQLRQQEQQATRAYQNVMANLPHMVGKPNDMKAAVELHKMMTANGAWPWPVLQQLSAVLERHPKIRVTQLQWMVSDTDAPALSGAAPQMQQATPNAPPANPALLGLPRAPFQSLLVEGEVFPFDYDYRQAMLLAQEFVQDLSADKGLRVNPRKWPLNVNPGGSLRGQAGKFEHDAKAPFSLQIILLPAGALSAPAAQP
ncbi:hypothetical protein V8J88_09570 [Massilia sp. W12]|uniref:hypothetical protein n=1 Tax=Massilia sp. W12 TaxID=3126507 RepID=UPI0030CF2454